MSTLLLAACLVIGVADGDTLRVDCPDRHAAFPVRLAGIDAPELKHSGFVRTAYQPWGNESKAALTALCLKEIVDVHRIAFDRNGRAVAFVTCKGEDASAHQVANGHAWSFMVPKGHAEISALEQQARAQRLGLWALPNPVPPADWRKAGQCS